MYAEGGSRAIRFRRRVLLTLPRFHLLRCIAPELVDEAGCFNGLSQIVRQTQMAVMVFAGPRCKRVQRPLVWSCDKVLEEERATGLQDTEDLAVEDIPVGNSHLHLDCHRPVEGIVVERRIEGAGDLEASEISEAR